MSTDRETTRIVRSWLEAGATALPDRVLDAVLDQVPATPQRRSWWPARRFAHMNSVRLAIAAAAVVIVAVFGYNLLPGTGNIGGPPTPIPSPTPTPSPSPPPILPNSSDIPAGTYSVMTFTNAPLTLTLPAGWGHNRRDGNFIAKGDVFESNGVTLATWQVSHVYRDACQHEGNLREAATPEAIVTALTEQAGHQTSAATDVVFGGLPATRIEFSVDAAFDVATCDQGLIRLWPDAGPNESFGLPIYPGQTTTIYVVDHGDTATLVVGIRNDDSVPGDVAELDGVLASVQFLP
jgi:hypothetical protein